MTGNEFQKLAARTMNEFLSKTEQETHALFGICGEVGEIQSIFQKEFQGHHVDMEHVKKEFGDLLWFIAEFCTSQNWNLDDVMELNIAKLKARYPDGFKTEQSLFRESGDI